jgi:hypothetical protein
MRNIQAIALICFFLLSCKKEKTDRFAVVYEVEFEALWSSSTHPGAHPDGAAFGPLLAISHMFDIELFKPGLPVSESLADYILNENTEAIQRDFQFLLNTSRAADFEISGRTSSPGTLTFQLGTARGYQHITLISKILPGPDWFVAARTSLIDPRDGNWYDRVTVEANAFHAGLDSAQTFLPPYFPLDTADAAGFLNYGPLTLGEDSVFNMGRFILRRIK